MRRPLSCLAAVILLGLCLSAPAPAAVTPTETYPKLLGQIDSRAVTRAVINRVAHDVKVTLRDSSTARAVYPPRLSAELAARLKAHGAQVKYTRRRHAATHHILRYIGGAVVLVIVAAGGGMFFYTRRRPQSDGRVGS
ncbi:MAG: hypothetical protein QOF77_1910 [Solirubrobacteraceae bacterium]|jgi:hypothetical protein|nr:hypothetical protein [Solirubrobacteraceae bacterium]